PGGSLEFRCRSRAKRPKTGLTHVRRGPILRPPLSGRCAPKKHLEASQGTVRPDSCGRCEDMVMGNAVAVTEQTFETEVLQSKVPVLVDLWAAWCGPCRQIAPAVEEIATEYAGRLKVVKVDVDENPEISIRYDV